MAVGGPTEPTDEEVEEKLDQVLKVLKCNDPVVKKINWPPRPNNHPEDHLLDMTNMDEKWFAARDRLRKAIAEMMYADECSWW